MALYGKFWGCEETALWLCNNISPELAATIGSFSDLNRHLSSSGASITKSFSDSSKKLQNVSLRGYLFIYLPTKKSPLWRPS